MTPRRTTVTETASETDSAQQPSRLNQISEDERGKMRQRLEEIKQRLNPGELARKLRKRKGMSIEEVGFDAGVDPEHVDLFEKNGLVDIWTELAPMRSFFDDYLGEESGEELLSRFIETLEPDTEEEKILRHDIREDSKWLIETIKRALPEDLWNELTAERPPEDPWQEKAEAKPKPRARSKAKPLSALGALAPDSPISKIEPANDLVPVKSPSSRDECRETLKFKLQLVTLDEQDQVIDSVDLTRLNKGFEHLEELGMTLSEPKQILGELQEVLVEEQVTAYLRTRQHCENCGKPHRLKGHHDTTLRTLFGNVSMQSPRFKHCPCKPRQQATFSPLKDLLTGRTSPELLFMEAKWAALVSYGMSAKALQDFLPVDKKLNAATVRNHALAVAERLESELGDERMFVRPRPSPSRQR